MSKLSKYFERERVGLFICCMEEGEKAITQFNEALPNELIKQATAIGIFGGEFNFERMNFLEKNVEEQKYGWATTHPFQSRYIIR